MRLEAEEFDGTDSAYGGSLSDTTSVSSSIYKGVFEHGRRYQSLKENADYWSPADEKQFESMATGHLVSLVHDMHEPEPLFRSDLRGVKDPQYVLDIGCGEASWAVDVADKYPHLTVYGVDLFPPPTSYVPPNLVLEVDDVTKPWTWRHQFDFVHLRWMLGSFSRQDWRKLYAEIYKNLKPGGLIEQVETAVICLSDDGTVTPSCVQHDWGQMIMRCAEKADRPIDMVETMQAEIEKAGFVNVKSKMAKYPMGPWARDARLKEVGRLRQREVLDGIEGYSTFFLTHFGEPEPWSIEQAQEIQAKMRAELLNKNVHSYNYVKRVWARKPFDHEVQG